MKEDNYLEGRLDKLHDKQDKLHQDLVEVKSDLKIFVSKVEEHVSSDKKIASEISPLVNIIPSLTVMVEDHEFKKEVSKRRAALAKKCIVGLGVISTLVGITVGIFKLVG